MITSLQKLQKNRRTKHVQASKTLVRELDINVAGEQAHSIKSTGHDPIRTRRSICLIKYGNSSFIVAALLPAE
jgi:hypothetical protein